MTRSQRVEFSVIIPTRDRVEVLERTLDALEDQRGAPDFEIVVVDDGSTDDTLGMLERRSFRRPAQVVSVPGRGPAQARNAGLEAATGDWIALLGSDTVPTAGWLTAHASRHRRAADNGGVAVIGHTSWHPRITPTPFLEYINEMGMQFGFALIDEPDDVPFNFFYSSNLSLHRRWLRRHSFDPRFPDAAFEDVELGYRLTREGLSLVYEPLAVVLHDHSMDLAGFMRRQQRVGRHALLVRELHPELCHFLGLPPEGPPSRPSQPLLATLQRLAITFERTPLQLPRLWRYLCNAHYRRGCIAAWSEGRG